MAKSFDNINLLPNPYNEKEDEVLLRATEKEIEQAFPEAENYSMIKNR